MIKLPTKRWFTFSELSERWQCTPLDIVKLLIDGALVPSYHFSDNFKVYSMQYEGAGQSGNLILEEVCEVVKGGLVEEVLETRQGFFYLMRPEVISPRDCRFHLFSEVRECSEFGDRCFQIPNPIPFSEVFDFGVVMATEVAAFEAFQCTNVSAEKPLGNRERGTLLNIIGALLELIQSPRKGRDSEAAVIAELVNNYPEKSGISSRTLQEKFALAKRNLLSD